jgi:hypothetical protein
VGRLYVESAGTNAASKGDAVVSGRAVLIWLGAVLLALWFVALREPPNDQAARPAATAPLTTATPAYVADPGLLLDKCVRFPYPDDYRPSDSEVWAQITEVQVEPCTDSLDLRVDRVETPQQGCSILTDMKVRLLGSRLGERYDSVLCLRWWEAGRP